jgi:Ca2+-binding RTX toxin-like protein
MRADALEGGRMAIYYGTVGADSYTGTADADTINGNGGNDTLNGGGGNDTVNGGDGNDKLSGGAGSDVIDGGAGDDTITENGDGAADTLLGGDGNDYLKGGLGDSMDGGLGTDDIYLDLRTGLPKAGFNLDLSNVETATGIAFDATTVVKNVESGIIIFSSLSDIITAGSAGGFNCWLDSGNDVFFGSATIDKAAGQDGDDQLSGGAGSDQLDGGAGNDTLNGDGDNDTLIGGTGLDTLNGGTGNDTLDGGTGNDVVNGDDGNDIVTGGVDDTLDGGTGTDTLNLDVSTLTAGAVLDLPALAPGSTADFGSGTTARNFENGTLRLGSGVHDITATGSWKVYAGGGDDIVRGAAQAYGEAGDDQLFGNGSSVLNGGDGNDQLFGGPGDDFDGGIGFDTIALDLSTTMAGVNATLANVGTATVALGSSTLVRIEQGTIHLGSGNDQLGLGPSALVVFGGAGADTITASAYGNEFYGEGGNDTLNGGIAADTIDGGDGNDTIVGNSGNDVITGGLGSDTMNGGTGYDRFVFALGDNQTDSSISAPDTIQGFTAGQDKIDLPTSVDGLTTVLSLEQVAFDPAAGGVQLSDAYVGDGLADVLWHYDSANVRTQVWVDSDDDGILSDADLLLTLSGNVTLSLSEFSNSLAWRGPAAGGTTYGDNKANRIYGGDGGDTIYGLLGDDIIYGGGGRNYLFGGTGHDVLYGGNGGNDLNGGGGDDVLWGGNGNDHFNGAGDFSDPYADGVVYGTAEPAGNDVMHGGGGDDEFWGDGSRIQGDGTWLHDYYYGDDGNDLFYEVAGEVTVDGGSGDDDVLLSSSKGSADGGIGTDTLSFAAYRETGWLTQANGGVPQTRGYVIDLSAMWNGGVGTISAGGSTLNVANFEKIGTFDFAYAMDFTGGDDVVIIGADYDGNIGSFIAGRQDIAGVGINCGPGNDKFFGGSGNDIVDGGMGNDDLYGEAGQDGLIGGDGNDILDGGTGPDHMIGGAGDDTYYVDDAPYDDGFGDIVDEGENAGTDTVITSVSIRVIYGVSGGLPNIEIIKTDNAAGTAAIDITGNDLANTITGNAGNNVIEGGAGADAMIGLAGDDTYYVDNAEDVISESGVGTDTVHAAINYVLGARLEDLVLDGTAALNGTGNSLNNVITGNAAANTLNGKAGADSMFGEDGDVLYYVYNAGDVVEEGSATGGTDRVISSVTFVLGTNVENLTLSGTASINGTGNTLNNTIAGNAAANTLNGKTGADTMYGGAGEDLYYVDNAGDLVKEGSATGGTDRVISSVTFVLGTNVENLTLSGTASINGTGNTLNNTITGNAAANTLNGRSGADTMRGGLGDDFYYVDNTGDRAIESSAIGGLDKVNSTVSFTLGANLEQLILGGTAAINGNGNTLANTITGNAAANILRGLAGADILRGAAGDDTLQGGADKDTLTGGTGSDRFLFAAGDTSATHSLADRITDFTTGDKIDLHLLDADTTLTNNQAFHFIGTSAFTIGDAGALHYLTGGGATWIEGDTNGDAVADFAIYLTGDHTMIATDFVL